MPPLCSELVIQIPLMAVFKDKGHWQKVHKEISKKFVA